MNASAYALCDDQRVVCVVPPEIAADQPRLQAQGTEAISLMKALNRRVTGNPMVPCRQITVLNPEPE